MENKDFAPLYTPLVIKKTTIRNRLEAAPVSMGPVQKGAPPCAHTCAELRAHSGGGVGLYSIGEIPISDMGNRRLPIDHFDFRDLSPENLLPYGSAAKIIHENGCVALAELCHCGMHRQGTAVGPMEIDATDGTHVAALDEDGIQAICSDFTAAALYMKHAGFDGVMLHFGHGWLVHQFLSPLTNQRTDRFGGSVENRTRLGRMILEKVREQLGEDFLIALRMSGDELCPNGYDYHEFLEFAKVFDPYADIMQVSMGLYGNPVVTREFPSVYHEDGCNVYIAEALKKVVRHAKVSVVGAINSPELAAQIIALGQSDLVAMGRQMFADPNLPEKAHCGEEEKIIPCLRCFCCFSGPLNDVSELEKRNWKPGCSVNPLHMRYEYMDMPEPEEKKTVLVVGGGIAGLYFAGVAAKRGHRVTVTECTDKWGGILNCVAPDPHKKAYIRFLRALEENARGSGAELLLHTEADTALIDRLSPDTVVAAVGARPAQHTIPIADEAHVLQAVGAMSRLKEIGQRVIILGGGLIGAELAVFLRQNGRQVCLAARSQILKDVYPLHGVALRRELQNGIICLEKHAPVSISGHGVILDGPEGEAFLPADTVIIAFGLQARTDTVEMLRTLAGDREFYSIGDCKAARRIRQATEEAFLLGMHLGTSYRPQPLESHWN